MAESYPYGQVVSSCLCTVFRVTVSDCEDPLEVTESCQLVLGVLSVNERNRVFAIERLEN